MKRLALPLLAVGLWGCSDRVVTEGLEEPLAVHGAQFVAGDLPGLPPLTSEEITAGTAPKKPAASAPSTDIIYLRQGLSDSQFYGLVSDDALSVAVQVLDQGSGYWLFPAGAPDLTQEGYLNYSFIADLHESLPAGRHDLLVAAIDADGKSGTQGVTSICVNSLVPDNGNACYPETQPPDLVVSLTWDAPVDLDFVIVTPSGKVVDSSNPTTAEPGEDNSIDTRAAGVGNLDLDSNKDCHLDGRQQENLVFQTVPREGRFLFYARLNRNCGHDAVRYALTFHGRVPGKEAGTFAVESDLRAEGSLIADQANGGVSLGTYVTDLKIGN